MKVSLIVAVIAVPLALLIAFVLVRTGVLEPRQSYFLITGSLIGTLFNVIISAFDRK